MVRNSLELVEEFLGIRYSCPKEFLSSLPLELDTTLWISFAFASNISTLVITEVSSEFGQWLIFL